MSIDNRRTGERPYGNIRSGVDIGMGVLYIVIGCLTIYVKYFGTIVLSGSLAYTLGGILIAYGLFRIVRAWNQIKRKRLEALNPDDTAAD